MDKLIRSGIVEIIKDNTALLRIPLRQKAKFEGWLKFELAHYLEQKEMKNVEIESKAAYRRDRTDITSFHNEEPYPSAKFLQKHGRIDITFFHNEKPYSIELKTPNTNWKIQGVNTKCRPITKNIQSVIDDAKKLNSENGIVAFVLFPIPIGDNRWEFYLNRINEKINLKLSKKDNCDLIDIDLGDCLCSLLVCTFKSRRFHNW
jgi:hypothetical protein